MIKPNHINIHLAQPHVNLKPAQIYSRLRHSRQYTPKPYLEGAELYIPKTRLNAKPSDVPLFPPRPPPATFFSTLRSLPIFRLAAGGCALGATATFLLFKTDDSDEKKNRVDIGTFDGRGGWLEESSTSSFTYTYKGGKFGIGSESTSVHALHSEEQSEAFLKKNEQTTRVNRPGNPVSKIDENVLPSKTACEDRHAIDIVSRADIAALLAQSEGQSVWDNWANMKIPLGEAGDGKDDLVFVSVFDGHMGSPAVSDLLKKTFHTCMAWMIAASGHVDDPMLAQNSGTIGKAMFDTWAHSRCCSMTADMAGSWLGIQMSFKHLYICSTTRSTCRQLEIFLGSPTRRWWR